MKRFIKNLILYLGILLVLVTMVELILPFNPNSFTREQLVKNELLKQKNRKPSIVLVGGSSVVFGFQSRVIIDSLNTPVINDGMQAGLGLKMSLDNCSRFLISGDTLVIIPEYSHFFAKEAWGGLYLADLFYLDPRDFGPMLNLHQYYTVANNTPMHIKSKIAYVLTKLLHASEDTGYGLDAFNEYGDKISHYGLPNKDFFYEVPIKERTDDFNELYFHNFMKQIKNIEAQGVEVFLFPPPMANRFYQSERINVEYVKKMLSNINHPFICDPTCCVYSDTLFFDSYYHLNQQGSLINSRKLVSCIQKLK